MQWANEEKKSEVARIKKKTLLTSYNAAVWCFLRDVRAVWCLLRDARAAWCFLRDARAVWCLLRDALAVWCFLRDARAVMSCWEEQLRFMVIVGGGYQAEYEASALGTNYLWERCTDDTKL